jgi:hypothetical protein
MQLQILATQLPAPQAKARNLAVRKLSGTKFRQMLRSGADIPEWFAFRSVVEVLREHSAAATTPGPPPAAVASAPGSSTPGPAAGALDVSNTARPVAPQARIVDRQQVVASC